MDQSRPEVVSLPLSGRVLWIDPECRADEVVHLIKSAGGTATSEMTDDVFAGIVPLTPSGSDEARALYARGAPVLTPAEATAEIRSVLEVNEIVLHPDDPVVSVSADVPVAEADLPVLEETETAQPRRIRVAKLPTTPPVAYVSPRKRRRQRMAIGVTILLIGVAIGFALGWTFAQQV